MSDNYNVLDNGNGAFAVQKFGSNPDIDTVAAEDVWDGGGLYSFPSAAAVTTIESDNAADTAAGTGARTITIEGLDSDYNFISETVTLNGVTAVTLANEYIRVFRAYNVLVGSNGVNVGDITIQHGATVLAQITAAKGQTLMAIYTVPANYPPMNLFRWYATVGKQANVFAEVELRFRKFGEGWRVLSHIDTHSQGSNYFSHFFEVIPQFQPKSDILIRVAAVSANNTEVSGGFDLKA